MPNLAHLVANRMATTVDLSALGADPIHIEYHLAQVSGDMIIDAANFDNLESLPPERMQTLVDGLPDRLLPLIGKWDLSETAPDGSEIILPITRENIVALGFVIQMAMLRTILSAKGEARATEALVTAPSSAAI